MTASESELKSMVGELFESARLRKVDIDAAYVKWRSDRSAFLKGARLQTETETQANQAADARRLQVRFLQLRRLQSEHEALTSHYDANSSENVQLYAVDPHVLTIYADAWNDSILTGFDFLDNEWREGDQGSADRRFYMLHLLSALFHSTKLGLTSSAREALLQTITFFTDREDRPSRTLADRISVYEDLLDRLETESPVSEDVARRLELHFRHLTAASTFRPAYPDIELGRMNHLLRSGVFLNIRKLIADSNIENDRKKEALQLYDAAMRSPEAVAECQLRIDRAFRVFLEATEIPSATETWDDLIVDLSVPPLRSSKVDPTVQESYRRIKHRNTEHLQRRAILEIHLANLCLAAVGARAEIRYITLSVRLFFFVSSLTKKLQVPLVHPRFYFGYENAEFYRKMKDGVDNILGAFSGALEVIETDKIITDTELTDIERFEAYLQPLRDTNAFAAVHERALTVESIIGGIVEATARLRDSAQRSQSYLEKVDRIAGRVEDRLQAIRGFIRAGRNESAQIFAEYSAKSKDEDIYDLFRGLTRNIEIRNQPQVVARLVSIEGRPPVRMLCLPLTGAYRYMFSITNHDVIESVRLSGAVTDCLKGFDLEAFTKMLEKAVSQGDAGSIENRAMLHFARAFHAASYRDWSLADLLARRGLAQLDRVGVDRQAGRFYLLRHELYFLRHLAARGLGERRNAGASQVRSLESSMFLLREAASSLETAYRCEDGPENFSGQGPFLGAMTFRLALAFAAGMLELLLAMFESKERAGRRGEVQDMTVFSPGAIEAGGRRFAWMDAGFEQLSLRAASADPERAIERLSEGLLALIGILGGLDGRDGAHDSTEDGDPILWKYRLLRAEQILHFLVLLLESGRVSGAVGKEVLGHVSQHRLAALVESFKEDVAPFFGEGRAEEGMVAPFATIVCNYFAWSKSDGDESLVNLADRLGIFDNTRAISSHLDPLGLPKRITNDVLAEWARVLIDDLEWGKEFVDAFVGERS